MSQGPEQVAQLSPQAFDAWRQFGEWLSARYGDIRVNSVGHLVVPSTEDRMPFMLGIDDTDHGVVADLHSPFLVQVPADPQMNEIVAMNSNLASFGYVRIVPEDDEASRYALELRQPIHAPLLTQEWLYLYAELIPRISGELLVLLQPALGGARVPIA